MIRLVYASSATRDMSEDDLLSLLEQSRSRNKRQNVTGMLLYIGESFIQVLEGGEKDVSEIYEDIRKDDRNIGNILIVKETISERAFPDWSMGFKRLSEKDLNDIDGYTEFLDSEMTPEQIAGHSDKAISLLYYFKNIFIE